MREHSILRRVADALRHTPPVQALLRSETWRSLRHRLALATERRQHFTFTRWLLLPTQFAALAGPVVDVLAPAGVSRPLEIIVLGCSIGAEPYSIASVLAARRPDLQFRIRASDRDPATLEQARLARYTAGGVFATATISPDFVRQTFDAVDGGRAYVVKPEIARKVTFEAADVLDPALPDRLGTADIVFLQNLLINLPSGVDKKAFRNACRLLAPRAALFVDGMPVGLRRRVTRAAGLVPLDFEIQAIHEEARQLHGAAWPWHYGGLEPFNTARRDWRARYATIFLRQPGALTDRG